MESKADLLSERFLNFACSVYDLLKELGADNMHKHVLMQLFRSATSVGANYEEARGAESKQDFAHKMKIVLKESRESMYWLNFIIRSGINNSNKAQELLNENRQICDIIAKSLKTLNANQQR